MTEKKCEFRRALFVTTNLESKVAEHTHRGEEALSKLTAGMPKHPNHYGKVLFTTINVK